MKYQVYLNKQTSQFVNKVAEQSKQKPNTIVKTLIEHFVMIMLPSEEVILKEIEEASHGKGTK